MIIATINLLFLPLVASNNDAFSQSDFDSYLDKLEKQAYETELRLYQECLEKAHGTPLEKKLNEIFGGCGKPPTPLKPPKTTEDVGDPNCGSPEGIVDRTCWYRCENGLVTWPGRGDCPVVGTPYIINLAYKNGSLSLANNITYQVKFDFGGNDPILSVDKGSFDNAIKQDAETIVFSANNLSQNQNKSGVVILSLDNNNITKVVIDTNLTINGITRSSKIDPEGPSILSISTQIIDLVDKGFRTATDIVHQITPCINLASQDNDSQPADDKAEYLIKVVNCSDNTQKFKLTPDLPESTTFSS